MFLTGIAWCAVALYPLIVFFGLQWLPLHYVGGILLGLGFLRLVSMRVVGGAALVQYLLAIVLILVVVNAVVLGNPDLFKFYPVVVSLVMLLVFVHSLVWGRPMVERFARIAEPDLPPEAVAYTRKVTVVWCLFFLGNGAIALFTAVVSTIEIWTLYNGLLAYLLMGALFAAEWLVRRRVRGRADAQIS